MLELRQVSKVYRAGRKRGVEAVHGVDLNLGPGEFAVLTGRSGCGKTTLLNLMSGLTQPTEGSVLIAGQDIWKQSDVERSWLRNRKFGFVFQYASLMPALTVLENVLLPTIFFPGNGGKGNEQRAESLLDSVGIGEKTNMYPRQLSAGQQQRAVIARSLINDPEILLADEPTSNLDEESEKEVIALFQEVHAARGITVLLVTHAGATFTQGTRRIHMSAGRIESDSGERKGPEDVEAIRLAESD